MDLTDVVIELREDPDGDVLDGEESGHVAFIAELTGDDVTVEDIIAIKNATMVLVKKFNLRTAGEPFVREGYSDTANAPVPFWVWRIDQESVPREARMNEETGDVPEVTVVPDETGE